MQDAVHEEPDGSSKEIHFLLMPDLAEAFDRMLTEFSRETDRGAVLIAADIVADAVGSVIQSMSPRDFDPKLLKQMMHYPGTLAAFAARSDIAFLAGFIDSNAHKSVDNLRKLRNRAAHSQVAFSLLEHRDTLRAICDLGAGTVGGVNQMALKLLMLSVVQNLLKAGVKIEAEIGSNPFTSPTDVIDELTRQPEAMAKLEGRLPRMELALGVWLLLGLIRHKERAALAFRAKPKKD